jgi:uroporphyrinogen decarboxylase
MTKRDRVEAVCRLEKADRIPFVPAIYEHKAYLVGASPSRVCRDGELLYRSLQRELEVYDPDMLVVGVDVYNVEAEALGCPVRYFDDSNDVPAIAATALSGPQDLTRLHVPDPSKDGRMPMLLEVAASLQREYGAGMIIRGAVSGPFSIASELLGAENLLVACIEEPDFVRDLLAFTSEVTSVFGCAFARLGVEPIVFDSRATPKLCSPRLFRSLVVPAYRDCVIPALKKAGAHHIPLIIGGDTTPVLEDLIATGATQLLCDFQCDLAAFKRRCLEARVPFRANIDPRLLHRGPRKEIRAAAERILAEGKDQPGFLFGSGVVAFDCPPDHVLEMRLALESVN